MHRFIIILFSALIMGSTASAKTPPEVMTPYKAYKTALDAKDYKKAAAHAYDAWQKAEELMGDVGTTGDLAQNYADLGFKADLKYKTVKPALLRSISLAQEPELHLQREVSLALYATKNNKSSDFVKRFDDIVTLAETNGLSNSTFLGEIYTIRAEVSNEKMREAQTAEFSRKALEIFENATDNYASIHPWIARLYSGYGYEYEKDLVPALLEYQTVMQNTEQTLPKDHPFVMKALGRWMLMRDRIRRANMTKEAEDAGMCECWPFDKARNENVQPIKRVPGQMPKKAWISGYSIVEFDLTDDGSTSNPRILTSWPPEVFDIESLRAVKRWEYSPRTAAETDEDRTDLVVTMSYILKDNSGRVIE